MSAGDGFSYCGGRNGEFCVAVGRDAMTAYCVQAQLHVTDVG